STARQLEVKVDQEKAERAGLRVSDVAAALSAAFSGHTITVLHDAAEQSQVPVILRYPPAYRSNVQDMQHIALPSPLGPIPLSSVAIIREAQAESAIHHKDLRQV